ncbi:Guanine nucleotide exchange factor DBS [Dirofilaria immitis]|nr:Guanine nucleotide exchange factor DBS [Dirofilaria immitis]
MENVGSSDTGTILRLLDPPRSLWESSSGGQLSCYGSLTASTSSICASTIHRQKLSNTPAYEKIPKSDSATSIEAPKFHYDMDFDLRALKEALKSAEFWKNPVINQFWNAHNIISMVQDG